jgi:hypothetical protein
MSKKATDYIKRIQSWVTRQLAKEELEVKCSMQDVREVYSDNSFVLDQENPTVEEYDSVRQEVLRRLIDNKEAQEMVSDLTTVTNDPRDCEPYGLAKETEEITFTPPLEEIINNSLNYEIQESIEEDDTNKIVVTDNQSNDLSVPEQEYSLNVQEEVEKYFPQEKAEVHEAILSYVEDKVYRNAEDLQTTLKEINETQLAVFLKIADDHNKKQQQNYELFKQQLDTVQQAEEKKLFYTMEQRNKRLLSFKEKYGVVQQ